MNFDIEQMVRAAHELERVARNCRTQAELLFMEPSKKRSDALAEVAKEVPTVFKEWMVSRQTYVENKEREAFKAAKGHDPEILEFWRKLNPDLYEALTQEQPPMYETQTTEEKLERVRLFASTLAESVRLYDLAIQERAANPETLNENGTAEGEDLDELYLNMVNKSRRLFIETGMDALTENH